MKHTHIAVCDSDPTDISDMVKVPHTVGKGFMINLMNPKVEDICERHILANMKNTKRFNGAERALSVASHTGLGLHLIHSLRDELVLVTKYTRGNEAKKERLKDVFTLHDVPEVYTGDVIKPLQKAMDIYIEDICYENGGASDPGLFSSALHELQDKFMCVICKKLLIDKPTLGEVECIKELDKYCLKLELDRIHGVESLHLDHVRYEDVEDYTENLFESRIRRLFDVASHDWNNNA